MASKNKNAVEDRFYFGKGRKAKMATTDELFRKLRLIYAYIDNEANDISDKQVNNWKKIVDEAMSSGDENIKRLARRVNDLLGG